MGAFFRNNEQDVTRYYYEFLTRKDIGPTGDYVTPGLYFTNELFPAMEVRADRCWYKLHNGTIEHGSTRRCQVTDAEAVWIELKAEYLNWAMVK